MGGADVGTAARAIGLCGLLLLFLYVRGPIVPVVAFSALFGAMLKR